jgi:hypothetical protein
MSPCLFKGNLCDILSRTGITNDPKRDPTESTPEALHKLPRTFFVSSAETLEEEFV